MARSVAVTVPPPTLSETLAEAATLPVRLVVAFGRATLALGSLSAPDGPIRRPGGYREQLDHLLREDGGPLRLVEVLTELTGSDRPLGQVLARGGVLDRLMAEDGPLVRLTAADGTVDRLLSKDGPLERLLADGGALDRLVSSEGALERLLAPGGAVDRLTAPDGLIDRLLTPGGLADRLVADEGYLDKLIAQGGTLDQLVMLGDTIETLKPRLEQIAGLIPALSDSADALHRAVGPLGDLVSRLPGSRRRTPIVLGS